MKKYQPHPSQQPLVDKLVAHYSRIAPKNTGTGPILRTEEQRQPLLVKKAKITLSEEQITKLVSYNLLVKAFQDDVEKCCRIVYGNKKALQEKMEEIQQNPSTGRDLTWQVALHPNNFSKLAGRNICGVKNEQRKQAEEIVIPLSEAIERYTSVVQYARGCLSDFPQTEIKFYEKFMSPKKMAEILQTPGHSEREKGPLSNAEITARVRQHPEVQQCNAQIHYWSKMVFGNSSALQKQAECLLEEPSMGGILTQQLAVRPESFHKLAGVSMLGIKNKARRHAETSLSCMIESVDRFVGVVEQVREDILQDEHRRQERRKPSVESAESLYKQQGLSATMHHEVPETSKQAQGRAQSVRPRKTLGTRALALAS